MKKPSIAAFGLIAAIIAVGSLFIMREPVVLDEQAAERLGKNIGSTGQPVDAKTALAQGRKIVDTIADLRRANTSQKPIIGLKRGYGHEVPNPQQQQAIDQILASLPESTVLHMD
ncbi:MAG: hypothetical protein JXR40_05625, partial [Pontiellaceae bacterium]|nr:hypothetical protein [Pontiellaceae bacterium]